MNFKIDYSYITSVSIVKTYSIYAGKKAVTDDELVKILKGEDRYTSIGSDDHPEFKKLREELSNSGYIRIERGWWNGDFVLKSFTLNGYKFNKGEKFPCAAAMTGYMKYSWK